jgi:hypothetical protein
MHIARNAFCLFISLVALQFAVNACGQESRLLDKHTKLLDDINTAWAKRTDSIKSVMLTSEIIKIVTGRGDKPAEVSTPFARTIPKDDRVYKAKLEYAFQLGKASLTKTSHTVINNEGTDKTRPQKQFRATFDGKTSASFFQDDEVALPMGSIEQRSDPSQDLDSDADLLAFYLWRQPKQVLKVIGWNVRKEDMSVEDAIVDVDGVQCRRIRIPRNGSGCSCWTSALDVDPARDWVPVRWQTWLDGKLSLSLTIEHRTDEVHGPILNEWEFATYDEALEPEETRRGRVTNCAINSDIYDGLFTIKFPDGTHVSERAAKGFRYYKQQGGSLVPMDERDYGRSHF